MSIAICFIYLHVKNMGHSVAFPIKIRKVDLYETVSYGCLGQQLLHTVHTSFMYMLLYLGWAGLTVLKLFAVYPLHGRIRVRVPVGSGSGSEFGPVIDFESGSKLRASGPGPRRLDPDPLPSLIMYGRCSCYMGHYGSLLISTVKSVINPGCMHAIASFKTWERFYGPLLSLTN